MCIRDSKKGEHPYGGGQPFFQPPYIPVCNECNGEMRFGLELKDAPFLKKNYSQIEGWMFFSCHEKYCSTHTVVEIPLNSPKRQNKVLEHPEVVPTRVTWREAQEPSMNVTTEDELESLPEDVIRKFAGYKFGGFFPFFDELGVSAADLGCIACLHWFDGLTCYIFHKDEKCSVQLY